MTLEEIRERIRAFKEYYTEEEFEGLCNNCGKCCHEKAVVNGEVLIFMSQPCRFLREVEDEQFLCDVYVERLSCCPSCIKLEDCYFKGGLPAECAYVKLFNDPNYVPARKINNLRDMGRRHEE